MPKLTEISNGHVHFWANSKLCVTLTIDFYGELFQNPCDPSKVYNTTTELQCQYLSIYYSCCDHFDCDNVKGDKSEVTKKNSINMMRKFWPEQAAKLCKVPASKVHPKMKPEDEVTVFTRYDENLGQGRSVVDKGLPRCWTKTEGQIQTRSDCDLDGSMNYVTGMYTFDGRCYEQDGEKSESCPSTCIGGCQNLPKYSYMLSLSQNDQKKMRKMFDQLDKKPFKNKNIFDVLDSSDTEVTCHVCETLMTQLPGPKKCVAENEHCDRSFETDSGAKLCFDHKTETLKKLGLEPTKDLVRCPSSKPHYDMSKENCVVFCSEETFEFDQLKGNMLNPGNSLYADCTDDNCDAGDDGRNGFECGNERVCYGPNNPSWEKFLENNFAGDYDDEKHFSVNSIKSIEHCTILDGSFRIKFGDFKSNNFKSDQYFTEKASICKYVRKLRIITGHVLIHGWPGEVEDDNLDCFESLEEIWRKDFNQRNQDDANLAIDIQSNKNGRLDLGHIGFPRLRYVQGDISVKMVNWDPDPCNWKPPSWGRQKENLQPICQVAQNFSDEIQPNRIFIDRAKASQSPIKNQLRFPIYVGDPFHPQISGKVVIKPDFEDLKNNQSCEGLFAELDRKQCFSCHPSCNAEHGCTGPTEFDCVSCKFLIDMSAPKNASTDVRTNAFTQISGPHKVYKENSQTFSSEDKFSNQASCTLEDKCPSKSFKSENRCLPCHEQCMFGCNGIEASNCCVGENCMGDSDLPDTFNPCRNDYLEDIQLCVETCEGYSEKIQLGPLYENNVIINYPYYNVSRICQKCPEQCLGGCDINQDVTQQLCKGRDSDSCFNATDPEGQSNGVTIHRFVGETCSSGWTLLDKWGFPEEPKNEDYVPLCTEMCKLSNHYICEIRGPINSTDPDTKVTCSGKPADKKMVAIVVSTVLGVLTCIVSLVVYCWKKEQKARPEVIAKEMLNMMYPSDPIDEKSGGTRNNAHFANVTFINPRDLVLEHELGSGHFGRVVFAKYNKRLYLGPTPSDTGTLRSVSSSARYETVHYAVAVKELKLDDEVRFKTIKDIIDLVKRLVLTLKQQTKIAIGT